MSQLRRTPFKRPQYVRPPRDVAMKRTRWFPSSTPPRRNGWYEVRCSSHVYAEGHRVMFVGGKPQPIAGSEWADASFGRYPTCCDEWRGLAKKP